MIIRSHVWEPTGYKIEHDGKCVTIFSAPNYTYLYFGLSYSSLFQFSGVSSPAAVMNIDDELKIEYKQFKASVQTLQRQSGTMVNGTNGSTLCLPWKET